jgi:hypothetical protein
VASKLDNFRPACRRPERPREFMFLPRPDDVPSSVELRWRSGEHQAALTSSLCTVARTVLAHLRSSAAGRCRWPLARRNCLPASTSTGGNCISTSRVLRCLASARRTCLVGQDTYARTHTMRRSAGGVMSCVFSSFCDVRPLRRGRTRPHLPCGSHPLTSGHPMEIRVVDYPMQFCSRR